MDAEFETYDIFEELADGGVVWWSCVVGLEKTRVQLQALGALGPREFFAMNTMTRKVVGRVNERTAMERT